MFASLPNRDFVFVRPGGGWLPLLGPKRLPPPDVAFLVNVKEFALWLLLIVPVLGPNRLPPPPDGAAAYPKVLVLG